MNFIKIAILALFPQFLVAQGGIINNGAKITVMANTEVKVDNAGVENKGVGDILNTGNIYVDQGWTQTGTATYAGSGWMWFEGGSNQIISSVSPLTVPRLRVDNGQRLILGSDVSITNSVDLMNNGSIELGTNNLLIGPTATMLNYDATSYVITNSTGSLQRQVGGTAVVFPVGNASFNPATVTNTGVLDNFQLRVFDQVLKNGTSGPVMTASAVGRTWMLSEETVGGSDATLTFQWDTGDELSLFDRTNSGITHHLSGSLWDNPSVYAPATNISATTWTQTRAGFTSFSPFVVRDLNIDLPVELLNFDAKRISISQVNLDWSTASETNNQGFEVERMLDNEVEFTKVAWVDGNETTVNTSYYNLEDENGFTGVSYYRLKQLDVDGTISYSDIKAVEGWEGVSDIIDVFPNPVNDYINIRLSSASTAKEASIHIFDNKGSLILSKRFTISNNKVLQINGLAQLADALYMMKITTKNGETFSHKFVKE